MALQPTHELHKRRLGRNVGVAGLLLAFVALVFVLTMVKIQRGEPVQGFDHVPRASQTGVQTEVQTEGQTGVQTSGQSQDQTAPQDAGQGVSGAEEGTP